MCWPSPDDGMEREREREFFIYRKTYVRNLSTYMVLHLSWLNYTLINETISFVKQVADFGLSREEMVSRHASNIRGTYGYLDPEYISSRSFTKRSDVYSFGVLLFELITGRNPQQGLMEYVELVRLLSLPFISFYNILHHMVFFPFKHLVLNNFLSESH